MQYLIIVIKCIMGIISITVGIVCLKKVSKIPYPELRKKENYKLLDRYSYASQMIDCCSGDWCGSQIIFSLNTLNTD